MRKILLLAGLIFFLLPLWPQAPGNPVPVITDSSTLARYKSELTQLNERGNMAMLADHYRHISEYYYRAYVRDSMVYYITKAMKEYEKLKDTFHVYFARFRLYDEDVSAGKLSGEAEDFLKTAADYYTRSKGYGMAVNCHFVLSKQYKQAGKKELYNYHLSRAEEINQSAKDTNLQEIILASRWEDHAAENNWEKALNVAKDMNHLSHAMNSQLFIKESLYRMGVSYFHLKGYEKAAATLQESLSLAASDFKSHSEAARFLVSSYIHLNKPGEAQRYFDVYRHIRDSFELRYQADNYRELLVKYETEKKQLALQALEKDNLLRREIAGNQKKLIIALSAFSIIILIVSFIAVRNIRKRQQLKKLMELRTRISRDLHDEVGATLSSIHVYASVAGDALKTDSRKSEDAIRQIKENTRQVMENMSDIVWAIKAGQGADVSLEKKLKNYGAELLSPLTILCHYRVDNDAEEKLVNIEARRNMLMIAKEAMNNIAKYSKATEAWVKLEIKGDEFLLEISDNGCGFDTGQKSGGNGLHNMQMRTEALGGHFTCQSETGKGTRIECRVPVTTISD